MSNLISIDNSKLLINDYNVINLFIDFDYRIFTVLYIDGVLEEPIINMFPIKTCSLSNDILEVKISTMIIDTLKRGNLRTMGLYDTVNKISIIRSSVLSTTEDIVVDETFFKCLMKIVFKVKPQNKQNVIHVKYI